VLILPASGGHRRSATFLMSGAVGDYDCWRAGADEK
jgi:hypothetical protein